MNISTLSAIAETNRYKIIELLHDKPRSVGEIAQILQMRQPQASKHLKILKNAGIIKVQPHANQRIYSLSSDKFEELDLWLERYRDVWEKRIDKLNILLQEDKTKRR